MDWFDEGRGIDWDLKSCLDYNPQDGWGLDDIANVLAVVEGEHDGKDWHWLIRLNDERHVKLVGGCDYTGWDCRSDADSWIAYSAEDALAAGEPRYKSSQADWDKSTAQLRKQLTEGKARTRRELVGEQLRSETEVEHSAAG